MKKIILNIAALILAIFYLQSCNLSQQHAVNELFPNPSDTSKLLVFTARLSPLKISQIISKKSINHIGEQRPGGDPEKLQNGKDYRDYHFSNTVLKGIQAQDCDFRGSYFKAAKCNIADFSFSDFRVADLESAEFNKATLNNCNFDQASLFFLHANNALLDYTSFRGANMFGVYANNSSFRYCNLSKTLLRDTQIADADFTGSIILKTNFIASILTGAKMDSTDCSYSLFIGASLEDASFINARLHSAKFQGANLVNANFTGADLKGCDFIGAEFDHTLFTNAINIPKELKDKMVDDSYSGVLYK